jgi:hypothetical protein
MALIALYLERGAYVTSQEEAEAAALWASVRGTGARRAGPFDAPWFASLRRAAGASPAPPSAGGSPAATVVVAGHDWGDALEVSRFYGRAEELATLTKWMLTDHCRVVALLGLGGIGKTALAARLAQHLASQFSALFWRSLRNALPFDDWLRSAVGVLSGQQQTTLPEGLDTRLALLLGLLRLLRGDLRGLDLSRLSIRQAYLAEVEAQDVSLAAAHLDTTVLAEAFDYPTAVALSADGTYLAAGTSTGEVRLWRLADRTPLLAVPGHDGPVNGVALSGDGQVVASGGQDGTVRLWEAASGRPLATLHGHGGGVVRVALSADGGLLASGGQDGTARLWEAASGRLLATLHGHDGPVYAVALSADGQLMAGGSQDGIVQLWEVESERLLATLQGHNGPVWGVVLSGDGGLLASGSFDGTVKLWAAPTGR